MNIVIKDKKTNRLEDGIEELLNLEDESFNKVIQLLRQNRNENIKFWYVTDPCELPKREIQIGLSNDFDKNTGNSIGRCYFGMKQYNIIEIFKNLENVLKNYDENSEIYKRAVRLLKSRNLSVFKMHFSDWHNVELKEVDEAFKIVENDEIFEKFMDFENNKEEFSKDKKVYLKILSEIFGRVKEGNSTKEIFNCYNIPNLWKDVERYIQIGDKYNLSRYTNKKYQFMDYPVSDEYIRKEDEPDWNINEQLYSKIYEGMPENLSLEEKAMYIYIKLCQTLEYDQGYFFNKRTDSNEYSNKFFKEHLEGLTVDSKVTCFDFARVFSQFINNIDGDIESVIIAKGLNRGHFLNGLYTDNVSIMLEPINNKSENTNDLMKTRNGIELEGIEIIQDNNGVIPQAIKKVYPLIIGEKQKSISAYLNQIKELTIENLEESRELKIEAFVEILKEHQLRGNEAVQTFMNFERYGYFGKFLDKFFVGAKEGRDYIRIIILKFDKDDDEIYVFDTNKTMINKMEKREIMLKISSGEYVYESEDHEMDMEEK